MGAERVYLDHSATTPVAPRVALAMEQMMTEFYGNPSSLHNMGLEAERHIEEARASLGAALSVAPDQLVFTSGGTEANNLALRGVARAYARRGRHIIISAIEHSSVLSTARQLARDGWQLERAAVDQAGRVAAQDLLARVRPDTILVSVMALNNEVGTLQPVDAIGRGLATLNQERRTPVFFHVDAVQAFAKVPVRPASWQAQLVTVSAHKIHGPKGIGALYAAAGVRLEPLQTGGEQEQGIRPGTENVPGIVGFGKAVELARAGYGPFRERAQALAALKMELAAALKERLPDLQINGPPPADEDAAPHILNIYIPGLKGEMLVHHLEAEGIYVSTGSACTSRRPEPSHVLAAMGREDAARDGSLRISLSPANTADDVARLVRALAAISQRLRRTFSR